MLFNENNNYMIGLFNEGIDDATTSGSKNAVGDIPQEDHQHLHELVST